MKRRVGETELYELERYCSNVANVCLEPVLRLIQEVRERRTHEDKYRWRDLRKNPDDLPEMDVMVLAQDDDGDNFTAMLIDMWKEPVWQADCCYENKIIETHNVVAWKEIEQFDVSER